MASREGDAGLLIPISLPRKERGISDRRSRRDLLAILREAESQEARAGTRGAAPWLHLWRRQIAEAEKGGANSAGYRAVAWRGTVLGIILGVIVLFIIYLMVFKPALWG